MGKEQTSACWMQTVMSADAALLWDDGKLPNPPTQTYWTHQRWNGEYLYWQVSDGELTVVVVSHVVTLQALITLPAGGESETERKTERDRKREREVCVEVQRRMRSTHQGWDGEELNWQWRHRHNSLMVVLHKICL